MRRAAAIACALLCGGAAAAAEPPKEAPPAQPVAPPVELRPPDTLSVPPGPPAPLPADPETRYQELLEAQRRLEHRMEVAEKLGAVRARGTPPMGLGPDGFYLGSPDSGFQLRLRGIVQSDARLFADEGPRALTDAFLIRRARLYIEGVVANFFDFRLLPDFAGGQVTLFEAWVNLRPAEWLQLRTGKLKSPFGLERLQAEQNLVFVERGLPSALAPDRDTGLELHGRAGDGAIWWQLALLNGVPDSGLADVEPSSAKDVAARVFLQPLRRLGSPAARGLGVGVAATYGREHGSGSSPALAVYRTTGQQVLFTYAAADARGGAAVADGVRRRLSPQAWWYVGPLGVLAEYVWSGQEVTRGAARADLLHRAWQVEASVLLTGEDASFEGVRPRRPFDLAQGTLGAVEVGVRYGELRLDAAAFPVFADPAVSAQRARAAGGVLNWYFNRNVRFGAMVERTTFAGGAAGGDRAPELALLQRVQVSF